MKTAMKKINLVYDKLDKVNQWCIMGLMCFMCIDLLVQVISRYVFRFPLTWSEELARYIFVWIALLGASWCGRNHIHIRMTIVVNKLPKTVQRILLITISLFISAIMIYLFPFSIKIFMSQSKLKATTLGVTLGVEYLAAPVGVLLMAIQNLVDGLFALLDWDEYSERYIKED